MTHVISLDAYRPHLSGDALCLQCDNTWAAVAPIGTYEFQCPKCQTLKGVFSAPTAPEEVWQCPCGNQHFYITDDGGLCARCGLDLNIEE